MNPELSNWVDVMSRAADRLETLDQEATAAPWEIHGGSGDDSPLWADAAMNYLCASPDDGVRGGHSAADAALIVALRPTAVPLAGWLRACIRRAEIAPALGIPVFAIEIAHAVLGEAS